MRQIKIRVVFMALLMVTMTIWHMVKISLPRRWPPTHTYTQIHTICHTCMHTHKPSDIEVRIIYLWVQLHVCSLAKCVGLGGARWRWWLCLCHSDGVKSVSSYLEDGSLLTPSCLLGCGTLVSHCLLPSSPLVSLSLSPPCLIGTGLVSQWRCVHIQLVCVMLCCLVLLSNGRSGQESSWTHTHAQTYTHTETRGKSSQRLTIHSAYYHIASLSEKTVPAEGWGGGGQGDWRLLHPGVPSQRLGIAFTVMTSGTFPFPSNQKMPWDFRFKPELTIAGLTPKLTILTKQCQSQALCKQIHLSYMSPGFFSFRKLITSPYKISHVSQVEGC